MSQTARTAGRSGSPKAPVEVEAVEEPVTGQPGETPVPPIAESVPPTAESVDRSLVGDLEAILLTADRPATSARLAEAIGLSAEDGACRVGELVERLNRQYEKTGRAFRIEKVAGGVRLMTRPEHADAIAAFHKLGASARLSRAAIETLSIVAYRQPMTRAQIEAIRGVGCGEVLRSLLERRLVAIIGRADEVGRPILYGTSKAFLEEFGLATLKDLPPVESPPGAKTTGETPVPRSEAQPDVIEDAAGAPRGDGHGSTEESKE